MTANAVIAAGFLSNPDTWHGDAGGDASRAVSGDEDDDGTPLDCLGHDCGAADVFLDEHSSRPRARQSGIKAPAMTGDPVLERAVRVHINTLEWLPLFLTGLWLFAIYWNECVAAGLGVVWIIGRLIYSAGYMADPGKRSTGFLIQFAAGLILLLGAFGRIVYSLAVGGV